MMETGEQGGRSVGDHQELCLLDGIADNSARRLVEAGITGLEQVGVLLPEQLVEVLENVALSDARRVIAHARAISSGTPVVFHSSEWVPTPLILLDLETSDAPADDPWLIGFLAPGAEEVHQLVQLDPLLHGEQIDRLDAVVTEHPDALVASWGSFDRTALRKTCARLGTPAPEWVDRRWLDLYHWFRKQVALPAVDVELVPGFRTRQTGMKIDLVATFFGFERASPLSGGAVGMQYRGHRDLGLGFDVDAVLSYNREDVLALDAVVRELPELLGAAAHRESMVERVVNHLDEHGPLTSSEVAEALCLPRNGVVFPLLVELGELGCVRRVGSGRWIVG